VERSLAAILAADAVGYSRIMREDEPGRSSCRTMREAAKDFRRLKAHKQSVTCRPGSAPDKKLNPPRACSPSRQWWADAPVNDGLFVRWGADDGALTGFVARR
jgi:hypothetical protein